MEIVSNLYAGATLTLRKKRGFSVCSVAGSRSRDYQSNPHFQYGSALWELPTTGEHGSFFQGTVFSDPLHRIIRRKAVFSDVHQRLAWRLWESMKSLPY